MPRITPLLAGALAFAFALPSARADAPAPTAPANGKEQKQAAKATDIEVTWDKDPYYSDVDINIPLTDKPIPTISSDSEAVIYRDLIEGSLVPRYMLLEASAYPLPALGTYLKAHDPGFYRE